MSRVRIPSPAPLLIFKELGELPTSPRAKWERMWKRDHPSSTKTTEVFLRVRDPARRSQTLFNAFTEVHKQVNPQTVLRRGQALYGLMDTETGALKRYLLDRAKTMRPFHRLSRVSEEALEHLENSLRNQASEMIRRHPAKGSTIRP